MTDQSVRIEKWVYGGDGLGRLDGRVVMVPRVLPGETVRIQPLPSRNDLLRGLPSAIVSPAPERIEPHCPYFARCGGCHYQHAPYRRQLELKVEVLREVLARVGKLVPPEEIAVVSGPEWEYRNRVQFHLERRAIGFREHGSHKLCPVDRCPITSPKLNAALGILRHLLPDKRFPEFVRSIELFTNETEIQVNVLDSTRPVARRFFDWLAERLPGAAATAIDYPAGGDLFRVSHQSFFQVNRFLAGPLVEAALGEESGETALDLYAGVGLFSLPLARRFRKVTAIESISAAVRDLGVNAERAGLAGEIQTVQANVEDYVASLDQAPDFVLADPPRAGLGKRVVRRLAELRPKRLTIVACDPSTLARDLAGLLQAGFRIESTTMVDLFPQTYHLETVVRLA